MLFRLTLPWCGTLTFPNTDGWSFNTTVPYRSLTSLSCGNSDPDLVSGIPGGVPRRDLLPLSLLCVAAENICRRLCYWCASCCYTSVLTNASRQPCCSRSQYAIHTTAQNICFTQRSWTIRNIHGILQDALGTQSRWKAHNLHCKLNRRHW